MDSEIRGVPELATVHAVYVHAYTEKFDVKRGEAVLNEVCSSQQGFRAGPSGLPFSLSGGQVR